MTDFENGPSTDSGSDNGGDYNESDTPVETDTSVDLGAAEEQGNLED
jgi:hypothetical protein